MSRLPTPGSDNGTWGQVLNDFLAVEHNTDGTLKASGGLSTKADNATVVHITGSETISGSKTFSSPPIVPTPTASTHATTKAYVDSTVGSGPMFINVKDAPYNAVGDGVANDTTAIQSALTAVGYGGTVYIPRGNYLITSLTLNHSQHLLGSGWHSLRDIATDFGDSNYASTTYFQGTILRSTATSGSAISHAGSGGNNVMEGRVSDLMLIGPGSGTSIGISVGTPSIPVVKPVYHNVNVANFSTGVALTHNNEASYYDLTIRGCTKALSLVTGINANTFIGLNMQECDNGLVFEDATSLANTFVSMICQNITGTGATVKGESHIFTTPYFEVVTTRLMDFTSASHCAVEYPSVQGAGVKDMRVQSGCFFNAFRGLNTGAGSFTFTNAGYGSELSGSLTGLTDTGGNTHLIDLNNASHTAPKYIASGGGSSPDLQFGSANGFGARYGASGPVLRSGAGSPEGTVTAPVGSLYQRNNGSAGATLYTKENGTGNTGWIALAKPGYVAIGTVASSATPTPNVDTDYLYTVTALAVGATFGAPTGTPSEGQSLLIRINDNGTARSLAWNAAYRAIGNTLPTTTVINKTLYVGCRYNAVTLKWDVIAVALEA